MELPESKEYLLEKISLIAKANLSDLTIEEIKNDLLELIDGIPFPINFVAAGSNLFRGIKYNEKPKNLSELSYPPLDKARMGRANREGIQIFYAASDKNVPFYELKAKVGDLMILSEWDVMKDLCVRTYGFTKTVLLDLGSEREINLEEQFGEAFTEEYNLVYGFLSDAFCRDIPDSSREFYKLTNAIAELCNVELEAEYEFSNIEYELSGSIYPTIRMNGNADNIALKPEEIDKGNIRFASVAFVEVLEINENDQYTYKIIDFATEVEDGKLIWNNLREGYITNTTENLIFFYDEYGEICAITVEETKGDFDFS